METVPMNIEACLHTFFPVLKDSNIFFLCNVAGEIANSSLKLMECVEIPLINITFCTTSEVNIRQAYVQRSKWSQTIRHYSISKTYNSNFIDCLDDDLMKLGDDSRHLKAQGLDEFKHLLNLLALPSRNWWMVLQ